MFYHDPVDSVSASLWRPLAAHLRSTHLFHGSHTVAHTGLPTIPQRIPACSGARALAWAASSAWLLLSPLFIGACSFASSMATKVKLFPEFLSSTPFISLHSVSFPSQQPQISHSFMSMHCSPGAPFQQESFFRTGTVSILIATQL